MEVEDLYKVLVARGRSNDWLPTGLLKDDGNVLKLNFGDVCISF